MFALLCRDAVRLLPEHLELAWSWTKKILLSRWVTLDFGCWFFFWKRSWEDSESSSAYSISEIFNISNHFNTLLLGALWVSKSCQTLKMPTRLTDCLMEPDNLAKLLAKTGLLSATLNQVLCQTFSCFFHGFFVWPCCHLNSWWKQKTCPALQCLTACLYY